MVLLPKTEDALMTFLLIALLIAIVAMTGFVLADSGLRMWSAFSAIKAQQAMLKAPIPVPAIRTQRPARIVTQVSYSRVVGSVRQRAAA